MLTDKERIDVALCEYKSLRDEILTRTNSGFNMIAIGGTIVLWLAGNFHGWKTIAYLVVLAILYCAICRANWIMVKRCSNRVAAIEGRINGIAQEKLLTWESYMSPAAGGGFGSELWGAEPVAPATEPAEMK